MVQAGQGGSYEAGKPGRLCRALVGGEKTTTRMAKNGVGAEWAWRAAAACCRVALQDSLRCIALRAEGRCCSLVCESPVRSVLAAGCVRG